MCNEGQLGVWKSFDCRLRHRLATSTSAQGLVFTVSGLFHRVAWSYKVSIGRVVARRLTGHNGNCMRPTRTGGPLPIRFLNPVLLVATIANSSLFRYDDSWLRRRTHFNASAKPSNLLTVSTSLNDYNWHLVRLHALAVVDAEPCLTATSGTAHYLC